MAGRLQIAMVNMKKKKIQNGQKTVAEHHLPKSKEYFNIHLRFLYFAGQDAQLFGTFFQFRLKFYRISEGIGKIR